MTEDVIYGGEGVKKLQQQQDLIQQQQLNQAVPQNVPVQPQLQQGNTSPQPVLPEDVREKVVLAWEIAVKQDVPDKEGYAAYLVNAYPDMESLKEVAESINQPQNPQRPLSNPGTAAPQGRNGAQDIRNMSKAQILQEAERRLKEMPLQEIMAHVHYWRLPIGSARQENLHKLPQSPSE